MASRRIPKLSTSRFLPLLQHRTTWWQSVEGLTQSPDHPIFVTRKFLLAYLCSARTSKSFLPVNCAPPHKTSHLLATFKRRAHLASLVVQTLYVIIMARGLSENETDKANSFAEEIQRSGEQRVIPVAQPTSFRDRANRHFRRFWWLHLIIFCATVLIIALCL